MAYRPTIIRVRTEVCRRAWHHPANFVNRPGHDPLATLHPFPHYVEDVDAALPDPITNPARQRLVETIAAIDRARAEVELAAEPVRRLSRCYCRT
jgi:hypothetical protein